MDRTDEGGLVRVVADDRDLGFDFFGFENERAAANGELPHTATAKAAAYHNAVGILPVS
jgi:hypothetical protein